MVVEDSRVVQAYLGACLRGIPDLEVVAIESDGVTAVATALEVLPDVILMDIELPGQSGIEATKQIMARRPTPVLVLSAHLDGADNPRPFEALAAGAVEVIPKPDGAGFGEIDALRARLAASLHAAMASSPRRMSAVHGIRALATTLPPTVVAIASSTGGPAALHALLTALPAPYACPVVVAQHIEFGFEAGLCQWLSTTGHRVEIGVVGQRPQAGVVSVLRADANYVVDAGGAIARHPGGPERPRPSGDLLLTSVAERYGARAMGIVLSGMGRDGSVGLRALHERGCRTAVQDQASSVVFSMPSSALANGAATQALAPAALAQWLLQAQEAR
ncbi:MAG: response regulator [Deltaproteobacteria bacterium]|nr:response regulator [Deltaproteobacteria bacterium]